MSDHHAALLDKLRAQQDARLVLLAGELPGEELIAVRLALLERQVAALSSAVAPDPSARMQMDLTVAYRAKEFLDEQFPHTIVEDEPPAAAAPERGAPLPETVECEECGDDVPRSGYKDHFQAEHA